MTPWPSRAWAGRAAGAALLLAATAASVDRIPVPSQKGWAGAKERAAAGTGVELAYVRTGAEKGQPIFLRRRLSAGS